MNRAGFFYPKYTLEQRILLKSLIMSVILTNEVRKNPVQHFWMLYFVPNDSEAGKKRYKRL